jgi:hypothetical protein
VSDESELKTQLVKQFQKLGHYGRRVEDRFSVGFPDLVLVPQRYPVFFCEAKIVRNKQWFEPRARQWVELDRLSLSPKHAIPCLLGFDGNETYLHPYAKRAKIVECVKKTSDETIVDFFKRFYHERMEI